jgi:hypothetical protein
VPPWIEQVQASGDWFGTNGDPGVTIDLSSFAAPFVPDPFGSLYGAVSSLISTELTLPGSDNTTPWALYSCATPTDPPIPVEFPVTAVNFLPLAVAPPYPAYEEGN